MSIYGFEERCPKCGTEAEWVVPPIPGAKPFFQCEDGDCNWMSDDDFVPLPVASKEK